MAFVLLTVLILFAAGLLYTSGEIREENPGEQGLCKAVAIFILGLLAMYYLSNMSWIMAVITLTVLTAVAYFAWSYLGRSFPGLVEKLSPAALILKGKAMVFK